MTRAARHDPLASIWRPSGLVHRGWDDLDFGQALFTIRFYARRNFICHGEIFDLFTSKNFAGLAEYIDADYKILEDVLQMRRSYWLESTETLGLYVTLFKRLDTLEHGFQSVRRLCGSFLGWL